MIKILVADKSEEFCRSLENELSPFYHVRVCWDGRNLLPLYHEFCPDIFVLDMEMPYIDGITVVRAIRLSGKNTDIIATTACIHSDYTLQSIINLGVKFILPRPCVVVSVEMRIREAISIRQGRMESAFAVVDDLLLNMGLRMRLCGYDCVQAAMRILMEDKNKPVTKVIYPEVAEICGGNAKRVERAIRNVITDAWKNRDDGLWRMFFSPDCNGEIPCPSNSEFLARMVACLENRKVG